MIGLAAERYAKNLWSERAEGQRPVLVTCEDEDEQADFVIRKILEHREAGIDLRRQAVLFRASHHSMLLGGRAGRPGKIPFHKYGGLKFVETAHVKDLLAFLRLAENPRDVVAGGADVAAAAGRWAGKARQLTRRCWPSAGGDFAVWAAWKPPAGRGELWPELVALSARLGGRRERTLAAQVRSAFASSTGRSWKRTTTTCSRGSATWSNSSRSPAAGAAGARMLLEMALDPPNSTQDLAGPPLLDDDYLVLSTIHSAKGLEWDAVYVIHAADGNIPSDMATKDTGRRSRRSGGCFTSP